eukprot:4734865-Prorocentrum_lima.AAC.1
METKYPERVGELRKIGRSRCCYTCREVWKSGECITLQDSLCEKAPYSTNNEGDKNNQDKENQESNGHLRKLRIREPSLV